MSIGLQGVVAAIWAIAMLALFIQAIRLSYRIEGRSPNLANTSGLPRKAMIFHTVLNRNVARDAETQALRRRMNAFLLSCLLGFLLFSLLLAVLRGTF